MERLESRTSLHSNPELNPSLLLTPPDNKTPARPELFHDRSVYDDALTLGREYYEASGELPSFSHFTALRYNGFFDYAPEDIERIFGDWTTFWADIEIEYALYNQQLEKKRQKILEDIQIEHQMGLLHPMLFKDTIPSKSAEQWQREYELGQRPVWNVRLFLDIDVEDSQKITRYVRYKIAEKLTPQFDEELGSKSGKRVDPLIRRTSIALGFNLDTGIIQSSLKTGLLKSNSLLVEDEIDYRIEEIATENDWLEFLDPHSRTQHLLKVKQAAEKIGPYPLPEKSFYNLSTARMLGKKAVASYLSAEIKPENIIAVGSLLADENLPTGNSTTKAYEYRHRTQDDDTAYGVWLGAMLRFSGKNLTARSIRRASQFNLGPSPEYLTEKYGSLINFYQMVGASVINAKGVYDTWDDNAIIAHIKKVAAENGGKVTSTILMDRINKGANEPRPSYLKKRYGSFGRLLEAAGISVVNRKLTAQDCIDAARQFLKSAQRSTPLVRNDFREISSLPSDYIVIRIFGSIEHFNEILDGDGAIENEELLAA